jgi:hypothetical protein
VKTSVGLLVAIASLAGARLAHESVAGNESIGITGEPFAPSASAAPIMCAGYRELAADLLFVRLTTYFGGRYNTASGVASLAEAIVALDPSFHRIYEFGARAITIAASGIDQRAYWRAIAILEAGMKQFPDDWRLLYAAGEAYIIDLQTKDPAQRRQWDERGAMLLESATRKPGAPSDSAVTVAQLRTRLGQHERAVQGLREMMLVTNDKSAQDRILDQLAKLEKVDATALAVELLEARRQFDVAWMRDRPAVTPTMYVLLGRPIVPGFNLTDLATGGRDLIGAEPLEKLEPLE